MATSAASVSLVDEYETTAEELSCGFCLQKLFYMEDPRFLPCHHVFCLPCLRGDFTRLNFVQCGICSKSHGQLNIDTLPTVKAGSSGIQIEETIRSGVPSCDVCTDNPAPTDKYCRDCGVKLCVEHFKVHEAMLRGSHEILSIEKFTKMRERDIRREICEEHKGKNLQLACYMCQQIFCMSCNMRTNCGKTEKEDAKRPRIDHKIQPLDTLAEEYRSSMDNMLKSLSGKISGMCHTEKQCWKVFDDVEEKVKLILAELDSVTAKQIERVKRKSEELKREIEDYLTESTERIEKHISDLVEQREQLDSTWSALINKLNHYSDTEFIRSYQTALHELKEAEEIEVSVFKPDYIDLSSLAHGESLGIHIKRSPPCLKPPQAIVSPTDIFETDSRSVCWKQDGALMSSGQDNITMFTETLEKSNSIAHDYGDCVRVYGDGCLVVAGTDQNVKFEQYSIDLEKVSAIAETDNCWTTHLSVSDSVIVAVEAERRQLAVYNAKTMKHEYDIIIAKSKALRGVCIYNKDTVLVSDHENHSVSLYELKENGKEIWTLDGLLYPAGICVDDYGFIYVSSSSAVMVLTKYGKVQADLSHEQMTCYNLYDVSIRGDKLAVACGDDGILIFDIQR